MHLNRITSHFMSAAMVIAFLGCGSEYSNKDSNSSSGGKSSGGASATSGPLTTAGVSAYGGGNTGGAVNPSGGAPATGGTPATGGAPANGGAPADGGVSASAGMDASAGTPALGGSSAAGGAASLAGSPNWTGTAGQGTFHVFLLLGQSNMSGYPKAQDADRVKDDRVKVLGYDDCSSTGRKKDTWDTAAPPLHNCWSDAIGPGDYFAKTLVKVIPAGHTIGLVPCAIAGEKIETFMKEGGTKYDWIVQRAKLAQAAGGVIEALLFHQGESNLNNATWPGKVNTLVTDLRTDLGIGNVPFIAGELPYDGSAASHNTLVNTLPSVVTNAFVVSANGLSVDPADTQWNLHFGHDSQVTLGTRYAEKYLQILGVAVP